MKQGNNNLKTTCGYSYGWGTCYFLHHTEGNNPVSNPFLKTFSNSQQILSIQVFNMKVQTFFLIMRLIYDKDNLKMQQDHFHFPIKKFVL